MKTSWLVVGMTCDNPNVKASRVTAIPFLRQVVRVGRVLLQARAVLILVGSSPVHACTLLT